jgi:hypothetical protein
MINQKTMITRVAAGKRKEGNQKKELTAGHRLLNEKKRNAQRTGAKK